MVNETLPDVERGFERVVGAIVREMAVPLARAFVAVGIIVGMIDVRTAREREKYDENNWSHGAFFVSAECIGARKRACVNGGVFSRAKTLADWKSDAQT